MAIYLYARVSTKKQDINRQIRNLKEKYPDGVIVQEVFTGTTTQRKEWLKLYTKAQAGDKIVFDSVSRMSRNAEEGFEAYQELYKRGIELEFLKEPHIDSRVFRKALTQAVPMTGTNVDFILEGINRYLLALAKEQIQLAFAQAEKEVEDLHKRTSEGMMTARLNGKQIGRDKGQTFETKKSVASKAIIKKHSKDFNGTLTDVEVMKLTGLARNTYYKYKRELFEAEAEQE